MTPRATDLAPPKLRRLRLQIDEEMERWLRDESFRRRVSIAQVVRDLVLAAMRDRLEQP